MPYTWQPFQSREQVDPSEVPSLRSEVLEETFAEAYESNPFELLNRASERRRLETGYGRPRQGFLKVNKIGAEDAIKMASDAGLEGQLTYDKPTSREAVELDIERKKTEIKRSNIQARSPGGIGLGTTKLAINIATSLADPSAVLNVVPVVGSARYAKWLASASPLGRVGVRAGVGALEGLAGAAIVEPFVYAGKRGEQADYSAVDSLLNVSLGTLTGAGLHVVGGTTADAYRRARNLPDAYTKITPAEQRIINAGKTEAPTVSRESIESGKADFDAVMQVASDPVVSPIAHRVGEMGDHTVIIRDGDRVVAEATAQESGPYLRVQRTDVEEAFRGKGGADDPKLGIKMAIELARQAEARELKLASDNSVSPAAVRVYDALERRGAIITRNPSQVNPATGGTVSIDPRVPPFVVESLPARLKAQPNAASLVAGSAPIVREVGLRQANAQMVAGEPVDVSALHPNADKQLAREDVNTNLERSAEADAQVKAVNDSIEALEEEATIERRLADDQAKQLGLEDGFKASDEYVKKIERWSKAAEIAQVCLVRGG